MRLLVTGGASGIGGAIVRRLVRDANHVVYFTYCRSAAGAQAIEREFANAHAVRCDFHDQGSVSDLLGLLADWRLQGLVNNALPGIRRAHFHKDPIGNFRTAFEHQVLPVLAITQAAIDGFRKERFGRIVTMLTSYLINRPPVGLSDYVAAKAYLASMSKSWAVENAAFEITSNCVSPSIIRSGLTDDVDERTFEAMTDAHPLRRLLTPEEVADAVSFLLTASPHVNGTNLVMNAAVDVL